MRDFCTNIREIAKMRGLTKSPCREGHLTKVFSTVTTSNSNPVYDRYFTMIENVVESSLNTILEYEGDDDIEIEITIGE